MNYKEEIKDNPQKNKLLRREACITGDRDTKVIYYEKCLEAGNSPNKVYIGNILKKSIIKHYQSGKIRITENVMKFLRKMTEMDKKKLQHLAYFKEILYDKGSKEYYFEMEYYNGKSLREEIEIKKRRFNDGEIKAFLDQIIPTLEFLKTNDVILRNLSTDHILIQRNENNEENYIISGLEHMELLGDTQTNTEDFYDSISQENSRFLPNSQTHFPHKTDYYSLGVIVYEMLTGQLFNLKDKPLGSLTNNSKSNGAYKFISLCFEPFITMETFSITAKVENIDTCIEFYKNPIIYDTNIEIYKSKGINIKFPKTKFILKKISKTNINSPKFDEWNYHLKKIINEGKIKSKNLIKYFYAYDDKDYLYLIQEDIGENLHKMTDNYKKNIFYGSNEIINLIIQILDVLLYKIPSDSDNKICPNCICPEHIYVVKEKDQYVYKVEGLEYFKIVGQPSPLKSPYRSIYYNDNSNEYKMQLYALGKTVLKIKESPYFDKADIYLNTDNLPYISFIDRILHDLIVASEDPNNIKKKIESSNIENEIYFSENIDKNPNIFKALTPDGLVFGKVKKADDISQSVSMLDKFKEVSINGITYLISKYEEGGSLSNNIDFQNGAMAKREIDLLALNLFNTLRIIHNIGIIHNDIKDENILLIVPEKSNIINKKEILEYKIIDWDVAKIYNAVGTKGYYAPEKDIEIQQQSDIWSAGVVLLKALVGSKNYQKNNMEKKLKDDGWKKDAQVHEKIHEYRDIIRIIEDCLKVNPQERKKAVDIFKKLKDKDFFPVIKGRYDILKSDNFIFETQKGLTSEEFITFKNSLNAWIVLRGCEHLLYLDFCFIEQEDDRYNFKCCCEKHGETLLKSITGDKHEFKDIEKYKIALDLIKGIEEMHRYHIIHRNIRPGNIYIKFKKNELKEKAYHSLKIGGISIAKIDSENFSQKRELSDPYISCVEGEITKLAKDQVFKKPELLQMLKGKAKHNINEPPFAAVDIWSYGATLYFLLYGEDMTFRSPDINSRDLLKEGSINKGRRNEERFKTFPFNYLHEIMKLCICSNGVNRVSAFEFREMMEKKYDEEIKKKK